MERSSVTIGTREDRVRGRRRAQFHIKPDRSRLLRQSEQSHNRSDLSGLAVEASCGLDAAGIDEWGTSYGERGRSDARVPGWRV